VVNKGSVYVSLVETHSRLIFNLAWNRTIRICVDLIDCGESVVMSVFTIIITWRHNYAISSKKRGYCQKLCFFDYVREQFGVSLCFQTIKHELGFRKMVVSTVENRRGKIVVGKTAQNLIFWRIIRLFDEFQIFFKSKWTFKPR